MKTGCYLFNCLKDPRQATRIVSGYRHYHIERNPGDLAYEHSMMNALVMNETVKFIPTGYYYFQEFTEQEIEKINATCDAFVCPLADVFSDYFLKLLKRLTKLVEQLEIPCIVPCVGLRAAEGADAGRSPDFDETVAAFVRAVLEKSSMIGVRGETTGRYLERLGFSSGRHFSIVGCPSAYMYGADIPRRAITPPPSRRFQSLRIWPQLASPQKGLGVHRRFCRSFQGIVFCLAEHQCF